MVEQNSQSATADVDKERQRLLLSATQTLERHRSLHSEREASLLFSSHLLSYSLPDIIASQLSFNNTAILSNQKEESEDVSTHLPSNLPGGVQDAHAALVKTCLPSEDNAATSSMTISGKDPGRIIADSISNGQLAQMCHKTALSTALQRASQVSSLLNNDNTKNSDQIKNKKENDYETFRSLMKILRDSPDDIKQEQDQQPDPLQHWFNAFYSRLRDIREYHAKHNTAQNSLLGRNLNNNPTIPLFPVMPSEEPINTKNVNAVAPASLQPIIAKSTHIQTLAEKHKKRPRQGNPEADGYDLSSIISMKCKAITVEEGVFSGEEVLGKYLDLFLVYDCSVQKGISPIFQEGWRSLHPNQSNEIQSTSISYLDFLSLLKSGLATSLPEKLKLQYRKKYIKLLFMLQEYLDSFLSKTSPLLNIKSDIIEPSMKQFDKEWKESGGIEGWTLKPNESDMVTSKTSNDDPNTENGRACFDLSQFSSPVELEQNVDKDLLKTELSKLGLKCGGTPLDRAKRLFMTRDTPFDQLPKKFFAKNKKPSIAKTSTNSTPSTNTSIKNLTSSSTNVYGLNFGNESRVDIARLESIVTGLLHQLRPTLDATHRRADRRLTQTINEREREIQEELYGTIISSSSSKKRSKTDKEGEGNDSDDDSDEEDEDAPIYNPKGVPLGWDGKPIPYWLFKLHGLNHFFPCEICGNESYRGRRNFEKHFTEAKHAYGMRCLGIPNTKHFHGVTKIEDAKKLWEKLKGGLEGNGLMDEEYEDSHGNVLKRNEYEDLARQGLL